ncbi:GNAT family N-acetyltransferase [Dyadobacter sp. CY345]|uniref:GNAT family N-acetyltransferase n=1 Tax=Dyadobacter sp. CY345 TaxID=2909335 RepID=UPI001F2C1D1A|nr:GNAT family N-acetyltransferase [Dyadobacter sp. CY345]MCF2443769.1 GNAT family N-acetyltransferase [Dyadobacter sp. CY345]
MEYSFDYCKLFGQIYLSDDKKACALISFPDRKRTNFRSVLLDINLITKSAGISNISKILTREKLIEQNYPSSEIYYLWFIGVAPENQNQGLGKKLLTEIIHDANQMNRPIYLETSTEKNLSWYQKAGFEIYNQLDFGYPLFLMRRK